MEKNVPEKNRKIQNTWNSKCGRYGGMRYPHNIRPRYEKKQTKNPRFTCNLKMINLAEKKYRKVFFFWR